MLGYDVQDAVKLIRGKEGTTVRLTIKKPDGTVKEVSLVRKRLKMILTPMPEALY
ncbi:hypothetical protein LWM68_20990 [Niabella sp. W65]|nr:hypothetical protein [Niabella sp. W65]MCH7365015.1 hypothetical protein [Niabella sp. W65]